MNESAFHPEDKARSLIDRLGCRVRMADPVQSWHEPWRRAGRLRQGQSRHLLG